MSRETVQEMKSSADESSADDQSSDTSEDGESDSSYDDGNSDDSDGYGDYTEDNSDYQGMILRILIVYGNFEIREGSVH